jgi:hypothetical protein
MNVENILVILAFLACPVGMGLLMWLVTRSNQHQMTSPARGPTGQGASAAQGRELDGLPAKFQALPSHTHADEPAARGTPLPVAKDQPVRPACPVHRSRQGNLCLNWKVVAGLAVIAVAIWIVAPSVLVAALPLLVLAACPLSMLLLMRGVQGGHRSSQAGTADQPVNTERTASEQLAMLKAKLADLQAQHEATRRAIAELEAACRPALQEAETVAQAGWRERDQA